jgi:OOP family OmpA-OmpF porin
MGSAGASPASSDDYHGNPERVPKPSRGSSGIPPVTSLRCARWWLALWMVTGCAGTQLAAGVVSVRAKTREARQNGALRCAPRELALAEVNAEFADRELGEGDYFRAREHLQIADDNARRALTLSPREACLGIADIDGDHIADARDKCPLEAEDRDGFEDDDGCPDLDNDKDGVPDAYDKCPLEAEDRDGFEDGDGCPDPDNDKDQIADASDKCPLEAEDRDGFEDDDGCPDPDDDQDGVADADDSCPREAGPAASHGCPKKYQHIVVTDQKIELRQKIFFGTNRAAILPQSFGLLSEIGAVLRSRPSMRLRVEGHTDTIGPRDRNMTLSQARAEAVKEHLIGLGVAGERLEAVGYGPDQPIETNRTTAGREKNRRVEFVIIQQ